VSSDPLWFRWNGAAMIPMRPELAERQFRPDGHYLLEAHHERSYQRHKAYFASLHEAWSSLRVDDFPTPEHLRKFALIKTGHYDERVLACDTAAQAERVSSFVRPLDEFSIIVRADNLVRVWTAKSQSYKAMGRDEFNRSMDEVLDYVADLVGVRREELDAQGGFA
jgi:hypothetical protein